MAATAHSVRSTGRNEHNSSPAVPHSRRVSNAARPSHLRSASPLDSPSSVVSPPTVPARSVRRPPTRSITPSIKSPTPPDSDIAIADPMPTLRGNRSFASLTGLLDSMDSNSHDFSTELTKGLVPVLSDSPLSPVDVDEPASSSSSSLTNSPPDAASSVSKRTHALLELLSSERAYASDLALIRDVHIPLALGP
jgi:hypothetical protein